MTPPARSSMTPFGIPGRAEQRILKTMPTMQANLWKIIILRVSWAMIVLQAIMAPFFLAKGLSLQDIFLVQALFGLTLSLCELPSGALSDLLGRRRTLILAALCRGLGGTGLVFLDGFWGMVVAYLFIALGNSLFSGTDIAALSESHRGMSSPKRSLKSYLGTVFFLSFSAATVTALIGSQFAAQSLELAAVVNMLIAWLALPVACTVRETMTAPSPAELEQRLHQRVRGLFNDVVDLHRQSRRLRLTLLAMAGYGLAPAIALYAYQGLWLEWRFPLEWFGFIFAAQSLVTAFCSRLIEPFYNRVGYQSTLFTLAGLTVSAFLLAAAPLAWMAVASVLLVGTVSGFTKVIFNDELNSQIPDRVRATINSLVNLLTRLMVFVAGPLVGYFAQAHGFAPVFLTLGLAFVGLFLFITLPLIVMGPSAEGEVVYD